MEHPQQPKSAAQYAPRRYLTERELAERLSLSVQFLRRRRARREPPHYAKFGESVRYPIDAIEAFEASAVQLPPLSKPRLVRRG
jgi:predicted DNA-binding transcriptional regulator AlpA